MQFKKKVEDKASLRLEQSNNYLFSSLHYFCCKFINDLQLIYSTCIDGVKATPTS